MRVISSIVALLILVSFPLALRIWREVDPHFSGRDQIVRPLAILYALTGVLAGFIAIILTAKRRPVAVGFGVYAILHGAICLYLTWSWGNRPGVFDVLAGVSICIGFRAVVMMRKKHEQASLTKLRPWTCQLRLCHHFTSLVASHAWAAPGHIILYEKRNHHRNHGSHYIVSRL